MTLTEHCRSRAFQSDSGQYAIAAALFELVDLIKGEIAKTNDLQASLEVEREEIKKDMETLVDKIR